MDIRDEFAARAMAALIAKEGSGSPETVARRAYVMANAMVGERGGIESSDDALKALAALASDFDSQVRWAERFRSLIDARVILRRAGVTE